jgi:hypothetical protein
MKPADYAGSGWAGFFLRRHAKRPSAPSPEANIGRVMGSGISEAGVNVVVPKVVLCSVKSFPLSGSLNEI